MTKISQWISSYRSSSTLLSIEPDAGEASNCCWCLCNCPWSLVTRSSNKLWTNNKVASLFLNCFGKVRFFLSDSFIELTHGFFFCTYLVRRGMQCSAAILPSMPTLANWSQNWSLSSSCSSLISSSSREATPLAVWLFNKIRSNR